MNQEKLREIRTCELHLKRLFVHRFFLFFQFDQRRKISDKAAKTIRKQEEE